jgi:hypothetical protein
MFRTCVCVSILVCVASSSLGQAPDEIKDRLDKAKAIYN